MRRDRFALFAAGLVLLGSGIASAEGRFVLRAKYPDAKPISTADLATRYDEAIIVDVRSKIEFDVIHIRKALHIPVAVRSFLPRVRKLRAQKGKQPLVFYCNGVTCAKSYKAVKAVMAAGYSNAWVFDAGIYEWARAHPGRTMLMGKAPADLQRLIPQGKFDAKKIDFATFKKLADAKGGKAAYVVDIRERFQRAKNPKLPQNRILRVKWVRYIASDRLVDLLKGKKLKDKKLLIADAVGKQVRWLQYYLEQEGYDNYLFLGGGVLAASKAGGTR